MNEHQMLASIVLLSLAVLIFVAREARLIAREVRAVAEIADRNERFSAKVLTMLAGIEEDAEQ